MGKYIYFTILNHKKTLPLLKVGECKIHIIFERPVLTVMNSIHNLLSIKPIILKIKRSFAFDTSVFLIVLKNTFKHKMNEKQLFVQSVLRLLNRVEKLRSLHILGFY